MPGLVADTHSAIWFLNNDPELSAAAAAAMDRSIQRGEWIYVATISLVEVTYLVEKGRVPQAAYDALRTALTQPRFGYSLVPLDLAVADAVRKIPRADVPDLPDRVIAATALAMGLPLVTRDRRIRSASIDTIW